MKINEILTEGFWSGVGAVGKGVAKGVAKGAVNIVAPGAIDKFSQLNTLRKNTNPLTTTTPAEPVTTPQSSVSSVSELPQAKVSGFEVLDQDPIRIRYNKAEYTLNNNAEWIQMGTKGTKQPLIKDINPTLEKLLDRAAGTENTSSQPSAKKPPAKKPPAKSVIQTDATKIAQVTTPNGTKADKWSDGGWSTPDGTKNVVVVDSDIRPLEQLLARQTSGQQPAVFSSNRRVT